MSKEEILNHIEDLYDLVESENDHEWNVGDMVRFTSDEMDGTGQIEGLDIDYAKVRVMAEAGDTYEPTDVILNLPFENLSALELDAESEEEPEEEEEELEKGTYVSWETSEGTMTGLIQSVDEKVVVEAILNNDLTGVECYLDKSDLTVVEPPELVRRRIVAKIKSYTSSEDGDKGYFEGLASAYGQVDLGGDTVAKGAYTQTLNHNDNTFQLMFDHGWGVKDVGGVVEATDTEEGLMVKAEMPIHIPSKREVFDLIKFMQEKGKPLGLSIGYIPVKTEPGPNNTRILKEIALHEVSITPYPMDTHARIREAKALKKLYESKKRIWNKTKKTDAPEGNRASQGEDSLVDVITELKTLWRNTHE